MYKTFNILLIFVCSFGDIHTEAKIGLNSSTPQNLTDLSAIQSKLQKILPIAKKSLVAIEANDGAGSGVIISEDGLVLTAAHVIGKTGKKMNVRLPNGRKFPAISLGGSEISDGGMLRITKKKNGYMLLSQKKIRLKLEIGALQSVILEVLTKKEVSSYVLDE